MIQALASLPPTCETWMELQVLGSSLALTGAKGKHTGESATPGRAARAGTDLYSPAGVRPKFGHSLEHIVPRKKPPPPPPGKETGAGGVAAALRGPAPPARAQAEAFRLREGESQRLEARSCRQPFQADAVPEGHSAPAREEGRAGGGAAATQNAGAPGWRAHAGHTAHAPERGPADTGGPLREHSGRGGVINTRFQRACRNLRIGVSTLEGSTLCQDADRPTWRTLQSIGDPPHGQL
ncbi:uncharacterized protein [Oryctolagus cuniculus]|uniref:uncharacterized protein n=1 Tax=Oryctolagus cuniculus TaxID=9986 RepID=UPI00387A1C0E